MTRAAPGAVLLSAVLLGPLPAHEVSAEPAVHRQALSLATVHKPGVRGNGMTFVDDGVLVVGPSDADLQVVRRVGGTWKLAGTLARPAGANGSTGMATDAKTLVAGYRTSGTAYTWRREGDGWRFEGPLDFPAGGWGGWATAVEGDVLVVGASATNINGKTNAGAAYVFIRNGDAWQPAQRLTTQPIVAEASFGSGVAISGGRIYVGARHETDPAPHPGALYLFERAGDAYVERTRVEPSNAPDVEFGIAVAAEGDLVAVGARGYENNGGGVFLYHRVGSRLVPREVLHLPQSGFWTSYRIGLAAGRVIAGARSGASALFVYGDENWVGQTVPTTGAAVAITNTAMALADDKSQEVSVFDLPAPGQIPLPAEEEPPGCTPGCRDGERCLGGRCLADDMPEPPPALPDAGGALPLEPEPAPPSQDDENPGEPAPGGAGGLEAGENQGGAAGSASRDEDHAPAPAGCALAGGAGEGSAWMLVLLACLAWPWQRVFQSSTTAQTTDSARRS